MRHSTHVILMSCLVLACSLGPQPGAGDSSSTGSGTTPTTTGQSGTGTPTTGSTSATDPTTTTDTTIAPDPTGFIAVPDIPHIPSCDPFAQDCKPGEKCTWWADDGGSVWNATKCVPIAADPAQLGEPCLADGGGVSGEDDCDIGLMCWDVDAENKGICIAFCMGRDSFPTCPSGYACAGGRSGPAVCIPLCDPLAQNCPGDDLCIPVDDTFICVLDASGDEGQLHDPCEYINACDKGLLCISPSAASECDQSRSGCCEAMCDLANPDPCPGKGQICQPIFEPPPEGYEHVGHCSVPN